MFRVCSPHLDTYRNKKEDDTEHKIAISTLVNYFVKSEKIAVLHCFVSVISLLANLVFIVYFFIKE